MEKVTRKSVIEKNKAEKKKASEVNKGKRLKVGGIIALLFALLYVPSFWHWVNKDNIINDIIRIGYIEHSINADGLVVRDEVLLAVAGYDGKFIPEISEGERVSAFGSVATISNSETAGLIDELEEVRKKIVQAQNEKMKENKFFSEDIDKINSAIGLKVQEIIKVGNSNSMTGITALKADIDGMIEKKAAIAGENSTDSYINSLRQERDSIQKRIDSSTSRITSESSGIISYEIDGYEQELTPAVIKDLTVDTIQGIISEDTKKPSSDNLLAKDDYFAKIIKSYESHIVVILEKDKADLFEAGDGIGVRINDLSQEVRGEITYKSDEQKGKYIIAVRIDRCTETLSGTRKVNVDLVSDFEEGLKVPFKSLFNINKEKNTAEIFLIKANVASIRQVVILSSDNEYAIIKSPADEVKNTVSLYDTYILNYDNVKEGQIIN